MILQASGEDGLIATNDFDPSGRRFRSYRTRYIESFLYPYVSGTSDLDTAGLVVCLLGQQSLGQNRRHDQT